jgi:ribonuclease HII
MDEVGKGALAGPLTIGVVVVDEDKVLDGLRDSKRMSPKKREAMFGPICDWAFDWGIGYAWPEECDALGMDQAQRVAARLAYQNLVSHAEIAEVMVDGPWEFYEGATCVVGGDDTVPAISAASVLAKVTRDRLMVRYAEQYPEYGFEKHKGYGTPQHLAAIEEHGACPIHRVSWSTFQ